MEFTDYFDRTDSNDLGEGWIKFHSGVFGMTLYDKKVMNEAAQKSAALQFLSKPAKRDVMIRTAVACSAEAADARFLIGSAANATAALTPSPADLFWGFGCSLLFALPVSGPLSGDRTLTIWEDQYPPAPGLSSPVHRKSVTVNELTVKGGPDANKPDLRVMQELRVILTKIDSGTRVRAYLNNGDDDAPTLEYFSERDLVAAADGSFFHFLMGFGAAADKTLAFLAFDGSDYDYKKADLNRTDTLTLKQIVDQATLRYEGSSSQTEFADGQSAELARQFANDAQEEILNEIGDLATFMRHRELMTLGVSNVDDTFELPRYVERVISILHPNTMNTVFGGTHGYGKHGLTIGLMPGYFAGDYWVSFEVRKERMVKDSDTCVIPRRFAEVIVLGTAYRMAVWDAAAKNGPILKGEFREKLLQMKIALNKLARASRPAIRTVRPSRVYDTGPGNRPWGF